MENAGERRRGHRLKRWFWNLQKVRPSHGFVNFTICKVSKIILLYETVSKFTLCNLRNGTSIFIAWHRDCGCKSDLQRKPFWRPIPRFPRTVYTFTPKCTRNWYHSIISRPDSRIVSRENLRNIRKFAIASATVTGIQRSMSKKHRTLVNFRRFWRQFYVFAKHDFA